VLSKCIFIEMSDEERTSLISVEQKQH